MANSCIPSGYRLLPLAEFFPPRTPGALGRNDAADPNCRAILGDTPGSLGVGDHADPNLVQTLRRARRLGVSVLPRKKRQLHLKDWVLAYGATVPGSRGPMIAPIVKLSERYALMIAITPGVERDGVLQVKDDPGHAVVVIEDRQERMAARLSYGPGDTGGYFIINEKTPGVADHAINSKDKYTAFSWLITGERFDKAKAYIEARWSVPEMYTAQHQCTSEALEVATRAGLDLPEGRGKIDIQGKIVDAPTPAALLRDLTKLGLKSVAWTRKEFELYKFRVVVR